MAATQVQAMATPPVLQPPVSSPQSPTTHDVRHITSHADLLTPPSVTSGAKDSSGSNPGTRRPSRLATAASPRLGSRSPGSIPSSPSSIHSSSSAIFERDIEPLPSSIFENATTHPHAIHNHNHQALVLESSVPAVLTSAATALSGGDDAAKDFNIAVIAPASSSPPPPAGPPLRQVSIPVSSATSTYGSAGASRSPSPTRRNFSLPLETARPQIIERQSTGPLPPGSFPPASYSPRSVSASSSSPSPPSLSPLTHTLPLAAPSIASTTESSNQNATQVPLPVSPPPNTNQVPSPASKRLSFISYSDLLASAPLSSVPLSSIVAPATDEPPPHIPAVLGQGTSNNASDIGEEGGEWIGGEWVREGFGRGLEARLEEVLKEGKAPSMKMTA